MRYLSKKAITLYVLLISFLVIRVLVYKIVPAGKYINVLNPLFWLFTAILSYLLARNESNKKMRSKVDITQSVIIIMIIYCMLYFSLGLIFGYERSPYSHELLPMLQNLWAFVIIIGFQEYVRPNMTKLSPSDTKYLVLITLIFIASEIDFWNFSSNFTNNVDFFKYVSQTIIPLVVSNCLFTYLTVVSGNVPSTIYRGVISLLTFLLPIFPSINWLVKSMMDIILVVIVVLYVNYVDMKSARTYNRRQLKKESIVSYFPFVILLVLIVCFIGGMFKYQPIAVLSDSMLPKFSRGDAVIIEKIGDKGLKKLKKGTILYYSKEGRLIIHRIVSIKTVNGKLQIVTKGDNNNNEDPWIITDEDVIGTVKFMIPYIGYPSVLVNELLKR